MWKLFEPRSTAASDSGEVIRHEDPRHFCTECHAYTAVRIDCFECHADRGLARSQQGRLELPRRAWESHRLGLRLPRTESGQ